MEPIKLKVNSFDIFDTILARKVNNPEDIFSIIEKQFPFPNFKEYRQNSQNHSNHTIDDIYIKFHELYNIDKEQCDRLKQYEIETEISYSYLIQTNYNRVNDGDILISDMYLKKEDIELILKSIGFQKKVEIFVSPSGKRLGTIWPIVAEKYSIQLHLGDNEHSDIYMAQKSGLNAELTTLHKLTDVETFFMNNHLSEFALSLREFRHKNPYPIGSLNYNLYNDQAIYNIPLLILVSNTLYKILIDEGRDTLLLLTRDGCLLIHIFKLMYPDITCYSLESSRYIHTYPNQEYKDYLKKMYNHNTCLIFDLYGSFNSGRKLYQELFGVYPRVHLLGFLKGKTEYDGLTYSSHLSAEFFNVDTIGSLITLENGNFIRCPVIEYEIDDALIYKNTVLSFCNFINRNVLPKTNILLQYLNTIDEFKKKSDHVATHLRFTKLNDSQEKVFKIQTMHDSLTTVADKLGVHKGSIAHCGHRYTDYYQILFNSIQKQPLNILEIGLYLYGTNCIPSIELWRAYYGNNVKIYGFDHLPEFKKFHNPNNNIEIFIGSQKEINDLQQCLQVKYDIIIDDGPHDSKGQQTMFKHVFEALNNGGLYCIESLHWQPKNDYGMKTEDLFTHWKNGNICSSEFISFEEATILNNSIEYINFYPSKSSKWDPKKIEKALCIIKKNK